MTGPIRAGLVGLGAMGRNHARVLAALDGVEFVGAADAAGGALSGTPLVATVAELIHLKPDYVVVAAPTAFHEEIGLELADAGIHALIEKPLAPTVAGAQRLVKAFGARGLIAGVGHIERYNASLQHLRSRLSSGELGTIFQVATRRQGPFPDRIIDVGVVNDLATHDIDLTSWVTGRSYELVSAHAGRRSGRPHEDLITVTARLEDDIVANHLVNWLSPYKERQTVVTGEKGAFVADTLTSDLIFYSNGSVRTEWDAVSAFRGVSEGDVIRFAIGKREPLVVEHENFRDAVLGRDSDIVTLQQGLRTVVVAAAVLESAERGTSINVGGPQSERSSV